MKGMSVAELDQVIQFVKKHHNFGYVPDENRMKIQYPCDEKGDDFQLHIKYVDFCYDSRFNDIWLIKFRGFTNLCFATNHFNAINPKPSYFPYNTLFEWVMGFLKAEWHNKNILRSCVVPSGEANRNHKDSDKQTFTKFDLERAYLAGTKNIDFEQWYNDGQLEVREITEG